MQSDLTEKQRQVLDFLYRSQERGQPFPTRAELARAMGISTTAVQARLEALEKKGYLKRRRRARGIELLPRRQEPPLAAELLRLPVVGTIAAGQPIEAYQDLSEYLLVEAGLVRYEDCYVLRVQGHSMIGDGIHDGDLVIVHPQATAENGETVVALLEGNSVTLKRLYREKDYFRLQPANPYLEPMLVRQLTVQGKVVALLRRYA